MLEVRNVSKMIKDKQILRNINFCLKKGQMIALLGENGAGKTTTIKLILGLLNPTKGTILVNGISIAHDRRKYLSKIGYVSDDPFFYEELTGKDFITFTAGLWGNIDMKTSYHRNLLDKLDINSYLHEPIHTYSYGMKKKLSVFISLLHQPEYVIMDEPFNGIDAKSTHNLYKVLGEFINGEKGLLLSTHMLDVAEKICTHALVIKSGEIVLFDEMNRIIKEKNKSLEYIFLDNID